jgi:hypothetical protein
VGSANERIKNIKKWEDEYTVSAMPEKTEKPE